MDLDLTVFFSIPHQRIKRIRAPRVSTAPRASFSLATENRSINHRRFSPPPPAKSARRKTSPEAREVWPEWPGAPPPQQKNWGKFLLEIVVWLWWLLLFDADPSYWPIFAEASEPFWGVFFGRLCPFFAKTIPRPYSSLDMYAPFSNVPTMNYESLLFLWSIWAEDPLY